MRFKFRFFVHFCRKCWPKSYFEINRSFFVAKLIPASERSASSNREQETSISGTFRFTAFTHRLGGGAWMVLRCERTRLGNTYRGFHQKTLCSWYIFFRTKIYGQKFDNWLYRRVRARRLQINGLSRLKWRRQGNKICGARQTVIPPRSDSSAFVVSTVSGSANHWGQTSNAGKRTNLRRRTRSKYSTVNPSPSPSSPPPVLSS